jgi:beta-galactosidase
MRCSIRRLCVFVSVLTFLVFWFVTIVFTLRFAVKLSALKAASRPLRLTGGIPFPVLSGSFDYFRTRPEQWSDRLSRMRSVGLNAVSIRIPWNLHEPKPGLYQFDAEGYDLVRFVRLVGDRGMLLIVRLGPYIGAEWDLGGLPAWLFADKSAVVRSAEYRPYLRRVEMYFDRLLTRLLPHTFANGGPIVAFQIENEYGRTETNRGADYLRLLVELLRRKKIAETLFTADRPTIDHLQRSAIDGVLPAVRIGPNDDVNRSLATLNTFTAGIPRIVIELHCGSPDRWGDRFHQFREMSVRDLEQRIDDVLQWKPALINFHMLAGGTNFGLWNGATNRTNGYKPFTTSYDFHAPISECGDVHPAKFRAIQSVLSKHLLAPVPPTTSVPPNPLKASYGKLFLMEMLSFDALIDIAVGLGKSVVASAPQFVEQFVGSLTSGRGWILYRKKFLIGRQSSVFVSGVLHDRAVFYVGGSFAKTVYAQSTGRIAEAFVIGSASRRGAGAAAAAAAAAGADLRRSSSRADSRKTAIKNLTAFDILVENMGRAHDGELNVGQFQGKGFQGTVTLNGRKKLRDWLQVFIDFEPELIDAIR